MGLLDNIKNKYNDMKRISQIEKNIKNEIPITSDDLEFYNTKKDVDDFVKKVITDRVTNIAKYSKKASKEKYGIKYYNETAVLKSSSFDFIKIEDIEKFQVAFDEAVKTEDNKVIVQSTTSGGFGVSRAAAGALVLGPFGALIGFTKKKKTDSKEIIKKGKETPILKDVRIEITTKFGMTYKHIIEKELKDTEYNRKSVENKFKSLNEFLSDVIDNAVIPPRTYEEYMEVTEKPFNYKVIDEKES